MFYVHFGDIGKVNWGIFGDILALTDAINCVDFVLKFLILKRLIKGTNSLSSYLLAHKSSIEYLNLKETRKEEFLTSIDGKYLSLEKLFFSQLKHLKRELFE